LIDQQTGWSGFYSPARNFGDR